MMDHEMNVSTFCVLGEHELEGRILMASRDIEAGQMILNEFPIVKYPQWKTSPTCLGCYALIDQDKCHNCRVCNWPMCSQACCETQDHALECDIFAERGFQLDSSDFHFDSSPVAIYDVITPLRMLALKTKDKQKWDKLMNLMSHSDEWKKQPSWQQQHQKSIDFITQKLKLPNVDAELILELFGIAYVNDFSALVGDIRLRLAFPNAAMFSHNCTPNVVRHIDGLKDGHQIKCYAARHIKKGENLMTSYVDLFLPGLIRRDILLKSKHFECICAKCQDPSELGSHGSSIKCISCGGRNYLMPPEWKCQSCGHKIPKENANALIFKVYDESEALHSKRANRTVDKYEQYLKLYGNILHPDNLCLVRIKYTLVGFYGRAAGYRPPDLVAKPHLLDRKLQLARQVLSVLDKTEPGISSSKGVMLYEMHMPIFLTAQMNLNMGLIDSQQAKKEFEESIKCIEEAMKHLKYNSKGSFGNQLFRGAHDSLKQLQNYVKSISKK